MAAFNQYGSGGGVTVKADPGKLRLGVWNRLEPRPRSAEFSKALSAPIPDALFMLTKQWLFGEFKGEDTGTAVMAKVALKASPVSRFNLPGQAPVGYDESIPLEACIEAEPAPMDFTTQRKITTVWKKILKAKNVPASVFQAFLTVFPYTFPAETGNGDPDDTVQELEKSACDSADTHYLDALDQGARCRLHALSGKMLYALDFLAYIRTVNANTVLFENETLDAQTSADVTTHAQSIKSAIAELLDWFTDLFYTPEPGNFAWDASRLEYRFNLAVQNPDGSKSAVVAKEYYQGNPDWYAYELDNPAQHTQHLLTPTTLVGENQTIREKQITLLAADVDFPGMPNKRYWSFENGKINFGALKANTTDLALIAFAEFGFMYSNDWQIIPFKVPVGSLCTVENLVVTDCFGFKTKIEPANKSLGSHDWTMFNLSATDNYQPATPDARVFIPPVTFKTQEGPPVEKVLFLRDEMANMVWGIEQVIPDLFGNGESGYEVFHRLKNYLQAQATPPAALAPATHNYIFMTSTPENWIPFVPVNLTPNAAQVQIRLQRGRLRRNIEGVDDKDPVAPYGVLLTEVDTPYYIEEEEVPREGIQVIRAFQKARWYNGKNICWLGRQKKTGKGEGNSGLRFDDIQRSEEE
ncbi:MAG: hypothetical protein IPM36_24325 [Lewinellaceae bacterium]|nr:hypothetical protein [Lewinellaceae bacterium]